jgi:malonyl-CoA/methylmalonyl-CoA synthetase
MVDSQLSVIPGPTMPNHLFDVIRSRVRNASSVFIIEPGKPPLTYEDMFQRTGSLASALVSLGIEPGDRVSVQVEKSADMLMLYLACVRAGAVFMPLNTAYTAAELDYFIGDAAPKIVVATPTKEQAVAPIAAKYGAACFTLGTNGDGSLIELALSAPSAFTDVPRAADDLAALLYTSGTTGRSKGAMLTHDNLASNALVLVDHWQFTSADVLLHALPVFHTHGLFVATNTILMAGASMLFLSAFNADEVMRVMPQATAMMGVPTFYVRLLQHPALSKASTAHMRLFVSGSAPLLADTHAAWQRVTGHAILERYGMTETNMITSNPYTGMRVPGAVGMALDGVSVRVVNPETGMLLQDGEIGMIEVRGPNVFKGYWRMPEKTKAEFRGDGYFVTGDLGKIDENGYVHIVGRGKDLVITGGYNVYPKEVEAEIDAMDGVIESAVFGVPHPDFGEGVAAAIVLKPGARVTQEDVMTLLVERLAKFKQPKFLVFVEELPRNAMGKVQKNSLQSKYQGVFANAKP